MLDREDLGAVSPELVRTVEISLRDYAKRMLPVYNEPLERRGREALTMEGLAKNGRQRKEFVEAITGYLLRQDSTSGVSGVVREMNNRMASGALIELVQNVLMASFNVDEKEWMECGIRAEVLPHYYQFTVTQTSEVPSSVIETINRGVSDEPLIGQCVVRTASTDSEVVGGVGLGLILVQVRAANGELEVRKQDDGRTNFVLRVPRTAGG